MTSLTTESVLTSVAGFGLRTATPAQRAVCRIIDGLPLAELGSHPDVIRLVGGEDAVAALPKSQCSQVAFLAAIRSAKTLISLATAITATQKVDCTGLVTGEVPRISIVSVRLDSAQAGFGILRETVLSSLALRSLLVGEPTADSLMLRHPSGRPIEICCIAGAKAGATLVSRWSAGAIFDEAPRMSGQDESVINLDDAKSAVLGRLLPGAQALYIGSPWAPFGPIFNMVQQCWTKPSETLVVLRGTGPMLNPTWWTPARCARLEKTDPTAHRTDVLAEFADPETNLFASAALEIATRKEPLELPCSSGMHYSAAMDPGTRSNSWTLVIIEADLSNPKRPKYRVALAREWTGSKAQPLKTDITLAEIAKCAHRYCVRDVVTDQWSIDALKPQAIEVGLRLRERNMGTAERVDAYDTTKELLHAGWLELSPVQQLRDDLARVRKRVTQNSMSIDLPIVGGRHCDFAPSLVLAIQCAGITARRATLSDDDRWGGCNGARFAGAYSPVRYQDSPIKSREEVAESYTKSVETRRQNLLNDER